MKKLLSISSSLLVIALLSGCDQRFENASGGQAVQTALGERPYYVQRITGAPSNTIEHLELSRSIVHGQAERVIDLCEAGLLRADDIDKKVHLLEQLYNCSTLLRSARYQRSDHRHLWFEVASMYPLSTVRRPLEQILVTARDLRDDSLSGSLDYLRPKVALLSRQESEIASTKRHLDKTLSRLTGLESHLKLNFDPAPSPGVMPTVVRNALSDSSDIKRRMTTSLEELAAKYQRDYPADTVSVEIRPLKTRPPAGEPLARSRIR